MTTPLTTTNTLSARSRDSDISATGGPAFGPVELAAAAEHDGQRLDQFLAGQLPQLSRSRLQASCARGACARASG